VNPDGSHTVVIHHGNTSTQVNSDGTHSVLHHHNNSSIRVNSDATHTIIGHKWKWKKQKKQDL
jgi:hypothetical protein